LRIGIRTAVLLLAALAVLPAAFAQGKSTDDRALQLYAFGGATGTYTGLGNGRNFGVTAGVDVGTHTYFGVLPTLEVRGTYPFDKGGVDSQKNILAGLKVEKHYGPVHPYVDILFGRGQIAYQGTGFLSPDGTTLYQQTNSNIFSPGVGLDFDISPTLAIKADFQLQHYNVPVTTDGHIYAKPITIGVVYRFGYNQRHPD